MTLTNKRLRLRPSVAFVPLEGDGYQFFQGNSRRTLAFQIEPALASMVGSLDGRATLGEVASAHGAALDRAQGLARHLLERCVIEDAEIALQIEMSPWRRILHFLGDFFPSPEVAHAFERIRSTPVVVLGVGAVGSWVALQLAHTGVRHFVLIDPDVVERSNLNRSPFAASDVGRHKTAALAEQMCRISEEVFVSERQVGISNSEELGAAIDGLLNSVVVNCADFPSVDVTSHIVDSACQPRGVPYVIAGGYNLHLSLIGLTVIPGTSACYQCSRLTLDERQVDELADLRKLFRPTRNLGNLAPLAAMTASFAANEVIRLAARSSRLAPRMLNRRGEFNFLTNQLHFVDLPRRADCSCATGLGLHLA